MCSSCAEGQFLGARKSKKLSRNPVRKRSTFQEHQQRMKHSGFVNCCHRLDNPRLGQPGCSQTIKPQSHSHQILCSISGPSTLMYDTTICDTPLKPVLFHHCTYPRVTKSQTS